MKILFSPPDIGVLEEREIIKVLRSGWITTGPETKMFESRIASYCNTKRAVCMNSATSCMEMTLRLLNVGPGDEVIVPAYTYTASCSIINHLGATIIMVDSQENSYEMDYEKLDSLITERTKVIIPVDLGGVLCDYKKIYNIIERKRNIFKSSNSIQALYNRIIVLADSAHAFGATQFGLKAGEIADFTSFSFHAVKNLTTSEGGAITWRSLSDNIDNHIYNEFQLLSLHGQSRDALAKTKLGTWEYDIKYPAYKTNMTDIMAAIGVIQLERYPSFLKKRKKIIDFYNRELENMNIEILQHYGNNYSSSGHLYMIRLLDLNMDDRNNVIIEMAKRNIPCNVHYKPLPMMTAYKNLGFDINNYPNSFNRFNNEITLPLHTNLTDEMIEYIISNFKEIIASYD